MGAGTDEVVEVAVLTEGESVVWEVEVGEVADDSVVEVALLSAVEEATGGLVDEGLDVELSSA